MFARTSQPARKNKSAPSAGMRAGSCSVCSLSRLSAPLMLSEMKGLCWSCSRTGIHSWSTRFIPAAQVQAPATHPAAPVGLYLIKSARDQKLRGFTAWLQVEICPWVREASSFHAEKGKSMEKLFKLLSGPGT